MRLDARKEALLNEYKGNLFEFLVGISIARKFKKEVLFLESIPKGISQMLKVQEAYVRSYYPELLIDLPVLATSLGEDIIAKLGIDFIDSLSLVGKGAATGLDSDIHEGDLLIKVSKEIYPISIKLNKYSAATNTKSAGVKSFFSKYFNDCEELQKKVNKEIDMAFDEFSFALHNEEGLEWDKNFNEWVMKGLPTLPGELSDEYREIYLNMLYKMSEIFYKGIISLKEKDDFLDSLFPLIGFGSEKIVQATCFHKDNYKKGINQIMLKKNDLKNNFKIQNKEKSSYFNIAFDSFILQIRIKAMNKFINKSFKVNCSVKYL